MFCNPCTVGPRQFYPLRNNKLHNTISVTGSILEYALKTSGFEFVFTNDNTTDIPNYAKPCIAKIYFRTEDEVFISIEGRDNRLYSNFYNGSSWTGWNSTALKSDIQSGQFTIRGATTGEISSVRINFAKPMRTAPRVVVSWQDNHNTFKTYGMPVADKVDAKGFTVSALATATTESSWYGDLWNSLNHKKQILPWGTYRDGNYPISNFKFGLNLYIAVGASSKVQKRCSIIAANDAILIPHPEGFVTIVFNDTNRITVSGTTDNYQLREIRASDFFGV